MQWIKGFLVALVLMCAGYEMAHATVNQPTAVVIDNGNGVTTNFNYGFIIPYQADGSTPAVTVTYTVGGVATVLSPTLYTISGVNNPAGGTVKYPLAGSPIAAGTTLTIARSLAYTQPTAVNNFNFQPHTVEVMADAQVMQIQQLAALINASGGGIALNPLILTSGSNTWTLQVDTSGNLNITRTSGSGVLNLATNAPIYTPSLQATSSYANDTAAASGGVAVGQLYRNGSVTQVRVN